MALPNCVQRWSPERRTGPQIRMKISPMLVRNSNSPASRYFPRNFNTSCDAASTLREFQWKGKGNDEARMTDDEGSDVGARWVFGVAPLRSLPDSSFVI